MNKNDFRHVSQEEEVDYAFLGNFLDRFFSGNSSNMSDSSPYIDDMYEVFYDTDIPETTLANNLILYLSPMLLILGCFGNILSVIGMGKICGEVLSSCVYLAILGVLDTLILCTRCGNEWLLHVTGVDLTIHIQSSSNIACKVYPFAFNFILYMYRWLIVCVSIEVFIAVRFPDKMAHMCTLSRAKAIILLLTVSLICLNIHYFWTHQNIDPGDYDLKDRFGNNKICLVNQRGKQEFEDKVQPLMEGLITDLFPLTIVSLFVVLIIVYMCKTSQNKGIKEEDEAWRKRYLLYPYALKRLKFAILIICILFVVTHLPSAVFRLFKYLDTKHTFIEMSLKYVAQTYLTKTILDSIEYFFLSVKFYIYFVMCQQFRDEVCHLFRKICPCLNRTPKLQLQPQECPLLTQTVNMVNPYCTTANNTDSIAHSGYDFTEPRVTSRNDTTHTNV